VKWPEAAPEATNLRNEATKASEVNEGGRSACSRWPAFVKWLMDTDPPKEYQIRL
jgi:hypothetical protein